MPPPPLTLLKSAAAELSDKVELVSVRVPPTLLSMAPPMLLAILPERVQLKTVRLPRFEIPPPYVAEFPEMVELDTVRMPRLA